MLPVILWINPQDYWEKSVSTLQAAMDAPGGSVNMK